MYQIINETSAVCTSRFLYNPRTRSFTAMASDLGPLRDGLWWLVQLWPNSEKAGIHLRSAKTGEVESFVLTHKTLDAGGDIEAWHFTGTGLYRAWKVVIYND